MKADKIRDAGENRMCWLLARRSLRDSNEIALSAASALAQTTMAELAQIAGARWSIEECFETAKGELGLDQHEVRSFQG